MDLRPLDATNKSFELAIPAAGGSCEIQLLGPGELILTTPGDRHVIIDHISYYVDSQVRLFADGNLTWTRFHVTYRFGRQETPPESEKAAVRDLLTGALTRGTGVGESLGFYAADPSHGAAIARLEEARKQLRILSIIRTRAEQSLSCAQHELTTSTRRVEAMQAKIDELRAELGTVAAAS